MTQSRKTIAEIQAKKLKGEKITMLTAYDYPLAALLDKADIDIILVGDSLANVVLGLDSTKQVGMAEMIHHAKAVNRAAKRALVVGDMPFEAFQEGVHQAVVNAKRFVQEAGCNAVKLEWFDGCLDTAEAIVGAGIPVMGHVGLTPQRADQLGGLKVQGRDADAAQAILDNARSLERQGCFSIVLECIPGAVAGMITERLSIPVIGIGAGVHCDGQVLVTHDLLGLFDRYRPKFVKQYVDAGAVIFEGVTRFRDEVRQCRFPTAAHSFKILQEELEKIK